MMVIVFGTGKNGETLSKDHLNTQITHIHADASDENNTLRTPKYYVISFNRCLLNI